MSKEILHESYKHLKNIDNIRNIGKLLIEKEIILTEKFYNVMVFI